VSALDRQLQQARDEKSSAQLKNMALANQLRDMENERQDHVSSLQFAHSQLSPNGSAPDDLAKLVKAIEILSEGHAIHARGLEDAANLSSAENKDLEERLGQAEAQLKSVREELKAEKVDSASIREALAQERSKVYSLRSELVDEQNELKNLRSKFAAGETGSEALKERVANEEQKVAELVEKLAVADSNVQSFEQEISMWKERVQNMTATETHLRSKLKARGMKAKDLSQRIFSHNDRLIRILEQFGFSVTRQDEKLVIQRASKVNASTVLSNTGSTADTSSAMKRTLSGASPPDHYSSPSDFETLYWMSESDDTSEEDKYQSFISSLTRLDADGAVDIIIKRYKDVEMLARKYQKDSRAYREKSHRVQSEAHEKIAYRSFKEGDLALFLPTRNQATRPWAAFNVGAPHYFLREQDSHKLQSRDWLLARISKVEERIVDLSRSLNHGLRGQSDRQSVNTEASDGASTRSADDENPFELSDGLRWYMIDAYEEKPGAPTTPGLGKSTVAATNVDVKGSFGLTKEGKKAKNSSIGGNAAMATKTLSKSLDSRRSSSGSKKGHTPSPSTSAAAAATLSSTGEVAIHSRPAIVEPAEADNKPGKVAREDAQVFEEVRKDLLFGP
jgi:autophagy-related protein 11